VGAFIVETRSDPDGLSPVRFGWRGRMREVVDRIDAWQGEDHRYFRIRADDHCVYILRHDLSADRWELTFFRVA
jgi:hypothetical protein